MSATDELRKAFDDCTIMAGVELDFECVYITKAAALLYLDEIDAENAKLRELCETVIDDWMSKVCPTFPFCECGGEYESCADDTCGNQLYRQMLRELGVEVDE